ncbi:hypothetical protein [Kitasatospora sp. NPDC056800]
MHLISLVLAIATLPLMAVIVVATPLFLIHARTEHDHGPDCWWCHP